MTLKFTDSGVMKKTIKKNDHEILYFLNTRKIVYCFISIKSGTF